MIDVEKISQVGPGVVTRCNQLALGNVLCNESRFVGKRDR